MQSINEMVTDEYSIEKSKFITKVYPLQSLEEINSILEELKKEYKDATHHCYAYIYEERKHFSDDGEPGGTAGMPILNVLDSQSLDHILCVVVRYFGGIKLGAGGLVRAYTKGVVNALSKSTIVSLIEGYHVVIEFDYSNTKDIHYILKNLPIQKEQFQETVSYEFLVEQKKWEKLEKRLKPLIVNYQIIKKCIIKQKKN